MTERRVLRYEIGIDDQPHEVGAGQVLMVTPSRQGYPYRLEVWVDAETNNFPYEPIDTQKLLVFGTGHELRVADEWVGSCLDGSFVWHVYRV